MKHFVNSTIRGALGDTLQFTATQISVQDSNFNVWNNSIRNNKNERNTLKYNITTAEFVVVICILEGNKKER